VKAGSKRIFIGTHLATTPHLIPTFSVAWTIINSTARSEISVHLFIFGSYHKIMFLPGKKGGILVFLVGWTI